MDLGDYFFFFFGVCLLISPSFLPSLLPHSLFRSFFLIALAPPLFPCINKRQKVIAWVLDPRPGARSPGGTPQP